MKHLLLTLILMAGLLSAHADEYAYLTFMTTDGIKASVKVSSLKLTISGTTLTAGTKSFTLANLSKMYFSATDETTGIQQLTVKAMEDVTDIYDLQGRKVSKEQMRNGAYIIKTKQGTYKIIVK
jgi:hypothetical protein